MSPVVSAPAKITLAVSRAYGTCLPTRAAPLLWFPCPECGRPNGRASRMTACKTCDGSGRIAFFA